jgi:hypothetical protein
VRCARWPALGAATLSATKNCTRKVAVGFKQGFPFCSSGLNPTLNSNQDHVFENIKSGAAIIDDARLHPSFQPDFYDPSKHPELCAVPPDDRPCNAHVPLELNDLPVKVKAMQPLRVDPRSTVPVARRLAAPTGRSMTPTP